MGRSKFCSLPKKLYPSPEEALKALNEDCLREENERKEVELKAFLKTQMQSSFEVKRLHEKFLREKVVKNESHQPAMHLPSNQKAFPAAANKEKIAATPVKKVVCRRPLNPIAESVTAYQKQCAQYALHQQQLAQYAHHPMSIPLASSSSQQQQPTAQQNRVPVAAATQFAQGYHFMLNNPAAMAAFYHQQQQQLNHQHLTGFQSSHHHLAPYLQLPKSVDSTAYPSAMANVKQGQQHNHWNGQLQQQQPVKSEPFPASSVTHTNPLLQAFPQQQFQLDQNKNGSAARWDGNGGGYSVPYSPHYHLNTPMTHQHHHQLGFGAQQQVYSSGPKPSTSSSIQLFANGTRPVENAVRNNSSNGANSASPCSSSSNPATDNKDNEKNSSDSTAPTNTTNPPHNQWANRTASANPYTSYMQMTQENNGNSEEIGNELNVYLGDGNFLDFPDTMSCNALSTPYPAFDQLQ